MNQINAYLYSENPLDSSDGKWDYGLLKEIFENNDVVQQTVTSLSKTDRAFVVVPGAGNAGKENKINKELSKIDRVVLFITGDESAQFDVDKIYHKNIEIWIHYPHQKHKKYNRFFIGAPQHIKENLPEYPEKIYDIFFSGQITHDRRKELASVVVDIPNSLYLLTEGFAQGYSPKEYYKNMSKSKIVPCPAGHVVIDTFRFFEAIEMLCLPIGDLKDSKNQVFDFFNFISAYVPVEKTDDWNNLKRMVPRLINEYPNNMHQVVSWWLRYKRDLGIKVMRQVNE
jgi:hypothetical protein